jgi:hypothetical protein
MRRYYTEMLSFAFEHAYYRGDAPGFTFRLQQQTRQVMQRSGLLFRSSGDGFKVLYEAIKDEAGNLVPVRKLPVSFELRFWICPVHSTVNSVSALPFFHPTRQTLYLDNLTDRKGDETLFLNSGAPNEPAAGEKDIVFLAPDIWRYSKTATSAVLIRVQDAGGTVVRTEYCRPYQGTVGCHIDLARIDPGLVAIIPGVEETETYYRPESLPHGAVFGAVDLYAGPQVPETYAFVDGNGIPQPKTYTCRIDHQSSTWRYIVVPRFSTTLQAAQLSIEDAESRFAFGTPEQVQTIAGEKAFSIASVDKIPHQETPIKGLILKKNNTDLVKELPNPGPDQIQVRDTDILSEIFVYV